MSFVPEVVPKFVPELRAASVRLHTQGQLARQVIHGRAPTARGMARFLVQTREAHGVFRAKFPVKTRTDFVDALGEDLRAVYGFDIACYPGNRPGDYAAYLGTLAVPQLGCHWYNVVFAHLSGGGRTLYESMRGELPRPLQYYECSGQEDVDALRAAFEAECEAWSAEERGACLAETPAAFAYGMQTLDLLF